MLYLALACRRLGRIDESQQWLEKARKWFGQEEDERRSWGVAYYPDGGVWIWADMLQLRAETEAVCEGK